MLITLSERCTDQDIYLQQKKMNGEQFDRHLIQLESHLNKLYEKIRLVEEVNEYLSVFIQRQFSALEEKNNVLSALKREQESTNHQDLPIYSQLTNADGEYLDRDGTPLARLSKLNNNLCLPIRKQKEIKPMQIHRKQYQSNYQLDESKLSDGKYMVVYRKERFDDLPNEDIVVSFQHPVDINTISVSLINAGIDEVEHITSENESKKNYFSYGNVEMNDTTTVVLRISGNSYDDKKHYAYQNIVRDSLSSTNKELQKDGSIREIMSE